MTDMAQEPRVAILHHHFGPYHHARARYFQSHYSGRGYFLELAAGQVDREWRTLGDLEVPLETLFEGDLETAPVALLRQRLEYILTKIRPDVVVVAGYSQPVMRHAARWAKNNKAAVVVMSDSQYRDKRRHVLKERAKGFWLRRHVDAAFVAGSAAMDYMSSMGLAASRIWRGYDVVDNDWFVQGAKRAREQEHALRSDFELPFRYFLFVGRFVAKKNLFGLLRAYDKYQRAMGSNAWGLVLAGSGPQEEQLKEEASRLGLVGLRWLGFRHLDELPMFYALASALVLPSVEEQWGLVVNEAMACGTPVIASEQCGCVPDLVFPGLNGYVFNPYSVRGIVEAMQQMSRPSLDRIAMAEHARRTVATYDLSTWSRSLSDCVQAVFDLKKLGAGCPSAHTRQLPPA